MSGEGKDDPTLNQSPTPIHIESAGGGGGSPPKKRALEDSDKQPKTFLESLKKPLKDPFVASYKIDAKLPSYVSKLLRHHVHTIGSMMVLEKRSFRLSKIVELKVGFRPPDYVVDPETVTILEKAWGKKDTDQIVKNKETTAEYEGDLKLIEEAWSRMAPEMSKRVQDDYRDTVVDAKYSFIDRMNQENAGTLAFLTKKIATGRRDSVLEGATPWGRMVGNHPREHYTPKWTGRQGDRGGARRGQIGQRSFSKPENGSPGWQRGRPKERNRLAPKWASRGRSGDQKWTNKSRSGSRVSNVSRSSVTGSRKVSWSRQDKASRGRGRGSGRGRGRGRGQQRGGNRGRGRGFGAGRPNPK